MQKDKKKTAHFFMLENISITDIDEKYKFSIEPNISLQKNTESTSIEEINKNLNQKEYFFPYNDERYAFTCVTMIDCISKKSISDHIKCFWCRSEFDTRPIGCPLQFIPSQVVKQFHSQITNESYNICQNITQAQQSIPLNENDYILNKGYYKTEGCFCSFNCCLAYIDEHWKNTAYIYSKNLLYKMYADIYDTIPSKIFPAPHWKLLKEYGGFMTIEDFRTSFQTQIYIDKKNHYDLLPKLRPIGSVFEEQRIF